MPNRGIITSDGLAWVKIPAEVESLDILLAGDWHKGHACHADTLVKYYLGLMDKDPYMLGILLGDLFEAKFKASKGKPEEQVMSVRDQKKALRQLLAPYADRFVGAIPGNHDDRQSQEGGASLMEDLCYDLGIPFFEPTGVAVFSSERVRACAYVAAFRHGSTGGTMLGSGLNATHKDAWNAEADIYIEAHCHKGTASQALERSVVDMSNKCLTNRKYWMITNGALLYPEKSYGAMKGYPRTSPCQGIMTLKMLKGNKDVSVRWK
jgi:hypothetical protein